VRLALPSAVVVAALVAALLGVAAAAWAIDIEPGSIHLHQGRIEVAVSVSELFPPRVEESLVRGMPATLQVSAELWRHRTGWFDRLNGSFVSTIRVRYDVWSRVYLVEGAGLRARSVSTLDSVRLVLSAPFELPLAQRSKLPNTGRYYVVVSATLKPLSVEDVEEGEGWLSGEVEDKRHSGLGVLTAIPRSVFDAVRNFAGLGDQRARAITDDFGLDELGER
jgi:Domain of unknown function (DUF4390)